VLESKLVKKISHSRGETGSSQSWIPSILYRYQAGGRTYTSDFYASRTPSSSAKNNRPPTPELEKIVAGFSPGARISVYIAPDNPERVVLSRPESPVWIPLAVGIGALAISAGLLFW
jgi:hypothetical protein